MTDHRTAESGVSQATVEQVAGAPARPGNKWWTLVAVCLGIFMLLLDITIVTVALPDIQRGLGSSFSGLQWIVDAYALTLAAFLLTAGPASATRRSPWTTTTSPPRPTAARPGPGRCRWRRPRAASTRRW